MLGDITSEGAPAETGINVHAGDELDLKIPHYVIIMFTLYNTEKLITCCSSYPSIVFPVLNLHP